MSNTEQQEDAVWNAYVDKYNKEPNDASQLLNFSKNKNNDCINLNFSSARKVPIRLLSIINPYQSQHN